MMKFVTTLFLSLLYILTFAQGITTSQLSGVVLDVNNDVVHHAQVNLISTHTNKIYTSSTNTKGQFALVNIKPESGYRLEIIHADQGSIIISDIQLNLGENHVINPIISLYSIEVDTIGIRSQFSNAAGFSAGSNESYIDQNEMDMFPSLNRSLLDYLAISPQANGSGFLGKSSRDNYIAIDGSGFNNVYGIGGPTASLIGNVIDAEPFGIDALEEIQLNLNPYDVSQGGFTGGGINASTRSGSNNLEALVYSYYSHDNFVGKKISGSDSPISDFSSLRFGANLSGAIIKDKLFFFANYESNKRVSPGSNFLAARSGLTGSNVTRVEATDLDEVSAFLKENYDYETGEYELYDFNTENSKWMVKLEWYLNQRNRVSFRVNRLSGDMEDNNTNSGSFGSGNRVENLDAMSFRNSGQLRTVEATSAIMEVVSTISSSLVNKFSAAYSLFKDSRAINGSPFPSVDILSGGKTYISFGSHMFASKNRIDQRNIQLRNELSTIAGNHILKAGAIFETHSFEYDFTPAFYGAFVFDSLEDFYNSTPIGTLTPTGLSNGIGRPSSYSRRYSTAGLEGETFVESKFSSASIYLNDQIQFKDLVITAGIRADYNIFGGSPQENTQVSTLTFQNQNGETEMYNTGALPDNHIIISPRAGFEYTLPGSGNMVLRGGAGIYSGLPSMVRVGDQFVNNGLLQGEIKARNNQANQYPFNPDVNAYIPQDLSAPNSYDLNFVVSDYKAPSLLRANVGLDYYLQPKLRLSFDFTYGNDINVDHVRNANMNHENVGSSADGRFVFESNRLNGPQVLGAYVLDNSSGGTQYFYTAQLKKEYDNNWFGALSYTYGVTKDLNSFGASTTRTAFRNLPVAGNINDPGLAFSDYDMKHRALIYLGKSFHIFGNAKTSVSTFIEFVQQGRFSYTYASNGDVNNDGVPNNDLIYIPATVGEIVLEAYNSMGTMISIEDQWAALDQFISQSDYLSNHRGQIAERNGSLFPWYAQANLKLMQTISLVTNKHELDFIIDIFNVPNLINSSWGVRKFAATPQPIQAMQNGKFRVNPGNLGEEFLDDTGLQSRWQIQLGVKYRFM